MLHAAHSCIALYDSGLVLPPIGLTIGLAIGAIWICMGALARISSPTSAHALLGLLALSMPWICARPERLGDGLPSRRRVRDSLRLRPSRTMAHAAASTTAPPPRAESTPTVVSVPEEVPPSCVEWAAAWGWSSCESAGGGEGGGEGGGGEGGGGGGDGGQ